MFTQYIDDETFQWILEELNYEGASKPKRQDLISRAVGQLESDLASKFVVPLTDRKTKVYSNAPAFARAQVENALKAKIKSIIGLDQNRNLGGTAQTTGQFQNTHEAEYTKLIKKLLDVEVDFGFLLQRQAEEGKEPVQQLGLGRSDVNRDPRRGRY